MAERNAGPTPLPCPFCGKVPTVEPPDSIIAAWNVGCDASLDACPTTPCVFAATREDAIAAWNRRAPVGGVPAGDASDPEEPKDG